MSKFAFMVYVETEKSTGLIASRDEQAERIISELENIGSYVDLNGIGARSDSEYDIANVDVWMMDKRDEKEANEEYEARVLEAKPTDSETRRELVALRADRDKYKSLYETQKAIVDQLIAGDPLEGSNVYQEPRKFTGDEEPRRNLSPRDRVYFQYGTHHSERLSVQWSNHDDGSIEISADTMGREFAVLPQSGNVVRIKVIDR